MFQSIGTKIFLSMGLLVLVGVGGATALTMVQGNKIAQQEVVSSVKQGRKIQNAAASARFQNLLLLNQLISSDPYFSSYIAQASGSDLGFDEEETNIDTASIIDLINERNTTLRNQYNIEFDFAYLLDADGVLITTTDLSPFETEVFDQDPVVAPLIEALDPVTGYWNKHKRIYQIAGVPLANNEELVGFLILGLEAGNEYVSAVKENTTGEYAILGVDDLNPDSPNNHSYYPIAGSISDKSLQTLAGNLMSSENSTRAMNQPFEITLENERWIAVYGALSSGSDSSAGISVSLVSLDESLQGFNQLRNILVIVAISMFLIALAIAYILSRRIIKPLANLSTIAQDAARGNYRAVFTESTGKDELSTLTQAFDSLLSDLREKSDMENFMTSLARIEPEGEEDLTQAANRSALKSDEITATLIAVEFPGLLDPNRGPKETALQIEQASKRFDLAVKRQSGIQVSSSASSAHYYFDTKGSLKEALAAIMEASVQLDIIGIKSAIAITRGKVMTATIRSEGRLKAVSSGKPWQMLAKLLAESHPGEVIFTKNTKIALEAQGIDLIPDEIAGKLSKKVFYSLSTDNLGMADTIIEGTQTSNETVTELGSLGILKPDDIQPGMVINDRYEIISGLGAGGMGVVYKTFDRELADVIALKLLSIEKMDLRFVDLMKREIKLARKITDTHILRTYDFGEIDGLPYLSMEYIRGMTLKHVIDNSGKLPFTAALQVSKQLCAGLLAAHKENIAHRDVKPANLMLDFTGKVKLMDFGLAGGHADKHTHGGTPKYASPEQLLGKDDKLTADIYACGVVLYELFTGQLPFNVDGLDMKAVAKLKSTMKIEAPKNLNSDLPDSLDSIILKALSSRQENRPSSVQEILDVLETLKS